MINDKSRINIPIKITFILLICTFNLHAGNITDADTIIDNSNRDIQLSEIVIEAKNTTYTADGEHHIVTSAMRAGRHNAAELLTNISGVHYNPLSMDLTYAGSSKIKILVDSIDKDESYIKRMSPKRFDRIDIIQHPTGIYSEYDVIINFHTKPTYIGLDNNDWNQTSIHPNGSNSKGKNVSNSRSGVNFTYTKNKWNVDASISWTWVRQNTSEYYNKIFEYNHYSEQSIEKDSPTNSTYENNLKASIGLDYTLNDNHSISFLWSINPRNFSTGKYQTLLVENINTDEPQYIDYTSKYKAPDNLKNTFGLYYHGDINGWNVSASATANIAGWNDTREVYRSDIYALYNKHNCSNRYFWGGMDARRQFGRWNLSLSYYATSLNFKERQYETKAMLSDNNILTNDFDATIQFTPHQRFSILVNAGLYFYKAKESDDRYSCLRPKAQLGMLWDINSNVRARLNYSISSDMPSLMQMSAAEQFVDEMEWQTGNPSLKPVTNHNVSIAINLSNNLAFSGGYRYGSNAIYNITGTATEPAGYVDNIFYAASQYQNGQLQSVNFNVDYFRSLSKKIDISLSLGIKGNYAKYHTLNTHRWAPSGDWYVSYNFDKLDLTTYLSYNINGNAIVTPQSIDWGLTDAFAISAVKQLWKGRAQINLMWYPAIHITDGNTKSRFISPALTKFGWANNQFRTNNLIMLGFAMRFSNGKDTRSYEKATYDVL